MKRLPYAALVVALITLGCAGPVVEPGSGQVTPATTAAATPATPHGPSLQTPAQHPTIRASSHSSDDVITRSPDLWVWAEGRTDPPISRLVADPKDGVWGGQDGELFHFRVRADYSSGRVTYGRPDPAVTWLGALVWLSEGKLAGKMVTRHLVRQAADGQVSDIAPARSPAGVPFDLLDRRGGELHLRDRLGLWHTLSDDGFRPVPEFSSGALVGSLGLGESVQRALEHETGGHVQAFIIQTADRNIYALVEREQLFLFDTETKRFSMLGHPGLTPIASLNGQIVARYQDGVALVDSTGGAKMIPMDVLGLWIFAGSDGWFYNPPRGAINLITDEVRQYTDGGPRGGSVSALLPFDETRLIGATHHFGSLFLFDPLTGQTESWGRPIPELGQESGEEVAPIDGLAWGTDGYLYAAIGTGARLGQESHLVRLDRSGQVVAKTWLPDPVHGLVMGADGRLYGSGYDRVVVLPLAGTVR